MGNDNKHLAREALVAVRVEATEGVAIALEAAHYTTPIKNLKPTTNIAKYLRQFSNLASRGTIKPIIGSQTGGFSGAFELTPSGGALVTSLPPWAPIIQGLGYVYKTLYEVDYDAGAAGTYIDGELFQTAGGAKQIRLFKSGTIGAGGDGKVIYEKVVGVPADDDVYTSTTGTAGFTINEPTSIDDYGLLWRPDNDDKSVTTGVHFLYDTANKKATGFVFRGCRGNLEVTLGDVDEPPLCNFTLEGAIESYGEKEVPTVEPAFVDVAPTACMGVDLSILGLANTVYRNFSLNLNADLAFRKDLNDDAGVLSRYIKNWKPSGKIQSELVNADTFDYLSKITGQTEGTVGFVFTSAGIGKHVELYCPTVTIEDFQLEDIDEMMMAGCDFGAHEGMVTGRNRFAMFVTK